MDCVISGFTSSDYKNMTGKLYAVRMTKKEAEVLLRQNMIGTHNYDLRGFH